MRPLIINAELTNPPSSITSFRDVTLFCTMRYHMDVVVECDKEHKDMYVKWLRTYGAFDFVEDVLETDEENGVRLDVKNRKPPTICVNRIVPENTWYILHKISGINFL